jgi:hypothetical protein
MREEADPEVGLFMDTGDFIQLPYRRQYMMSSAPCPARACTDYNGVGAVEIRPAHCVTAP